MEEEEDELVVDVAPWRHHDHLAVEVHHVALTIQAAFGRRLEPLLHVVQDACHVIDGLGVGRSREAEGDDRDVILAARCNRGLDDLRFGRAAERCRHPLGEAGDESRLLAIGEALHAGQRPEPFADRPGRSRGEAARLRLG